MKPEFWESESVALCSHEARLLFLGLVSNADDEGRFRASGLQIRRMVYPHDDGGQGRPLTTAAEIERWRDELASRGLVALYRVGDKLFGHLPGWKEHQRVDHPGKSYLPEPPKEGDSRDSRETLASPRAPIPDPRSPTPDQGSPTEKQAPRPADAGAPPPAADVVLDYPTIGKVQAWQLTRAQLEEWATLYPGLDVERECRKAAAWIRANLGRRKTAGGMARFLVTWLNRAVDDERRPLRSSSGPALSAQRHPTAPSKEDPHVRRVRVG